MPNSLDPADSVPPPKARKGRFLNWVCFVWFLGSAISLTLFLLLGRQERLRDEAEFHSQIVSYMGALQEHRNGSEDLLRTLRALFFQDPHLSRQLFHNTVADLDTRTDLMKAIGWAPRVPGADRAAFEQAARQEGLKDFQILEGDLTLPSSQTRTRAADRPEYFPLRFIEPMVNNEMALGYDLASEPALRGLLLRTHNDGGAEVSGPIRFPYHNTFKTGVLAVMPVYYPEFLPGSPEARLTQNQGYVVAIFIIDEFMQRIAERTADLKLDVMFLGSTEPGLETAMGARVDGRMLPQVDASAVAHFRSHPHEIRSVNIGGLKAVFNFKRSGLWDTGPHRWVPAGALCIGLLLTGILGQAARSSSEKARQVEALVHVRTAELAEANKRLKAEVSERMVAQNQLAQEHTLLNLLLNRLPDPVHVTDRQGNYVLVNDAHVHFLQQPDPAGILGRAVQRVGPASLAQALAAGSEDVLLSGKAVIGREFTVAMDGEQALNLELSKLPMRDPQGKVDGLLVITRDVTQIKRNEAEQRELARRLQETQKLEGLGLIAGGIAHDFNNLLTIILGNANIARLELPSDSSIRECLSRIEATSLRAADLCKQMLAYSGKGLFVIRRIDISKLVDEITELLQLSIAKNVTLQFQLDRSLPAVLADSTQLQQILMNLVTNASEAIGDRDGVICIRSTLAQVDRKSLRELSPATDIADGKYVLLEITDNGSGITPEIQEKIFDPFFSTKFAGRGLGLAAVLGIVRSHRGAISVHSEVGRGSSFKIFLPPVEGPPEGEARPLEPTSDWKGRGTILLAEDEEGVRVTTAELLRAGGFSVDVAESGRCAIDKFRIAPQRYKAVLLDFAMPDGDGEEAFKEIRAIQPQTIILVMSGYNSQHVLDRFKGKGLNGFIQKPFQANSLMAVIRKVLEVDDVPRD